MAEEPKRWSGYETQSKPWQQGYEWEYCRGEHGNLNIFAAIEFCGYDLGSKEADEFEKGAEFAQLEESGS